MCARARVLTRQESIHTTTRIVRTFDFGDVLPDFACAALAVDGHLHHHHLHTHVAVPRTVSNAME